MNYEPQNENPTVINNGAEPSTLVTGIVNGVQYNSSSINNPMPESRTINFGQVVKNALIVAAITTVVFPLLDFLRIYLFSTNDAERGINGLQVLFVIFAFPGTLVSSIILVLLVSFLTKNNRLQILISLTLTIVLALGLVFIL